MRILFLTDNYPPECNAPAVRTHFHCREWVRQGNEVIVVTCVPNFPKGEVYDGYRNRLIQRERIDEVDVVRVWSYMAPNSGVGRRILDFVSYAVAATLVGVWQEFDVVVATSPQFFTAMAGAAVAITRGRPWVMEVRDLWPESIVATGAMRRNVLLRGLEVVEMALYRSARLVVPVTRSFKQRLLEGGVPARKIHIVPNGVEVELFESRTRPIGVEGKPLKGSSETNPFVVGYLGTIGMAHGLDIVLRAAELFSPAEVRFVLVGEGAEKAALVRRSGELDLRNVEFRDAVGRHAVPRVLAGFDACLVPLRGSDTFRSVLPSKLFEAAAARRPVLLGVRGEAKALVQEYDAGLSFEPESEVELAESVRRLRCDAALYQRLQRGAERLAYAFDRGPLATDMLKRITAAVR